MLKEPVRREGVEFICEVPAGTVLREFRGFIIAAIPGDVPHYVTEHGLVPIELPAQMELPL